MLLYHPFFDAHHCVFRMLQLLQNFSPNQAVEKERFRVWDFYLLFPSVLGAARLPQGATGIRKEVKKRENRYEVIPDARRAFIRLEPMQAAALAHLASVAVIDAASLAEGVIQRTETEIPGALRNKISKRNSEEEALVRFLTTKFFSLPMSGRDGLRIRTDLFDYRYDLP